MTISCGSCGVIFLESDLVFVTCCGHIFHQKCLFKKLDRQNCPQCFAMCTAFNVQRLYLSFTEETPKEAVLNDLFLQVNKIKSDINGEQRTFSIRRQLLLSWIEYEKYLPIYTNMIKSDYEKKLLEVTRLKQQKNNIEKRLNEMKILDMLQMVLACTPTDVEEILQTKISPDLLATIVVLLKRQIKAVDDEQKAHRMALRDSQHETKELYSKQSPFLEKIETLRNTNNKLKNSTELPAIMLDNLPQICWYQNY